MFLVTLSMICKCGILRIGCVPIWCASGRGFLFLASATYRSLLIVLSLGAQITRTGTYIRTHAHRQARARTPYYHDTQTKTKVDVR